MVLTKPLLRHNAGIHREDRRGNTGLFYAAKNNNLEAVKLLIESGADVNHENDRGKMASDWAKRYLNRSKMIELLESYQAMGLSAEEIKKGNVDELREAIELSGVDPNKKINGVTPLAYAACCCLPKVVNLLLEKKADPNLCGNYNGSPPLHVVVGRDNVQIARLLIMGKADVTKKDWYGNAALSKAINFKNSEMIKLLKTVAVDSDE